MNNDEKKTILLVEDEAFIAMSEMLTLGEYGYEVITVFTGEEAIETVEKSPKVDLVLMDINLGTGMDGIQAAKLILEKHLLPVIFLSSPTDRQVVEKTEGITSYGCIVKGSEERVLIASIKMAFRLFESQLKERQEEEALKALSLKDELTGLYNRRGFLTLAEQGLKTAQRMGIEMMLIFGDLDNMKGINDTFGHKEGDQALVDTSQILRETFRESDIIARIGGDEFVILAMKGLENSAEKLKSRFEQVLNEHHLQTKRSYTLSLTLGIAFFNPKNPSSIDALLAQADKLMYENKPQKGR